MAKVLSPEKFRKCPTGTVFAFGPRWAFGSLLILDCFVGPFGNGGWGFYATDPMWVESYRSSDASTRLREMEDSGVSYPLETCSTKYMNYDGDKMDVFFVLEENDWATLCEMIAFPDRD